MKWLCQVENIRQADRYAMDQLQIPGILLMETAARAVVDQMMKSCQKGQKVLVLCGGGNNGGDGFAIARMLKVRGLSVRIFLTADASSLQGDAKTNYDMLSAYQIPVLTQDQASVIEKLIDQSDWLVDAIFGTGLDRRVQGLVAQVINYANKVRRKGHLQVMAVDIPSGIQGNSGQMMGCAVEADETVTFCRLKPGLILFPGRDYAGKVTVADIGIPDTVPSFKEHRQFMLEPGDLHALLPVRQSRSHKGLYGHLLVVAGSRSMTGAAVFCGRSAYKMGTGLVDIAIPEVAAPVIQMSLPEAITTPYPEEEIERVLDKAARASAIVAGPGLSQGAYVLLLLQALIQKAPKEVPLVLDADALNWLAKDETLKQGLKERGGHTILTPHMGEASRLLHKPVEEIMAQPLEAVRELTEQYHSVAVLKDAMTLAATPQGDIFYNSTGNNGMSTAGSGDVLAGMIGGLCAQGIPVFQAAYTGVYLHGAAGDLARQEKGAYGMTASDIVDHIHLEKIEEMIANEVES